MKSNPPRKPVQARLFVPARNSECLCGSGDKFKRCCANNLPGFDIGKKIQAAFKIDDHKAALIAARSDVTQYTMWHKTNTAPQARGSNCEPTKLFCKMLKMDVEALSDSVEFLSRCYKYLDKSDEFPVVLERLRSNIEHPQWYRKIVYLHALEALGENWEREAGKRELKKLGSMDEETDVEILQLYVDLFHDELSFSTRQTLTERIAHLAERPAERLHYQCLSAINFLMVNDQEGAAQRLQTAIQDYSEARDEDNESAYALNFYVSALEILGQIRQDKPLLDNAITLLQQLIGRGDLTKAGIANAYQKLGDVFCCSSSWQEAKDAYSTAFEHDPHDILKIFISKCLLYLDDLEAAKKLMSTVETTNLTASEIADYVFIFSQLAIESGEKEELAKAERELRFLKIAEPYFQQQQNILLLSVIDTLRTGPSKERTKKIRGPLRKVANIFRQYIMFEPNFMGMGVRVGKIIEDGVDALNSTSKEK